MPIFYPPTADTTMNYRPDADAIAKAHGRHFKLRACGRSVLKIADVYYTIDVPTMDQINSCDRDSSGALIWYQGGHGPYEISEAEASDLEAAGYTVDGVVGGGEVEGGGDLFPADDLFPSDDLVPA